MIISHHHRYIFMHCRKVAGTAISVYFARHHGPHDLQVGAWPYCVEAGVWPNRRFWLDLLHWRPMGSALRSFARAPRQVWRRRAIRTLNEVHKARYRPVFGVNAGHPSASAVQQFAPEAWQHYFKFCFVRNPYEQAVSDYLWRSRISGQSFGFREFLEALSGNDATGVAASAWSNASMYLLNGEPAMDFIGRFENLEADLKQVAEAVGIPHDPAALPRSRGRRASDGGSYRDWYGPEEKRLVERLFSDELERFSYDF